MGVEFIHGLEFVGNQRSRRNFGDGREREERVREVGDGGRVGMDSRLRNSSLRGWRMETRRDLDSLRVGNL